MNATAPLEDRALGAFLGLGVGDALGTTLEFSVRDHHPRHTEMTGGGPFRLSPGVWTDDTAMALCLADSLIAHRGLELTDLMRRFVRWWRDGENSATGTCFDIGITTAQALQQFERKGDPRAGSADPSAAGNGSLVRLAPVAIFAAADPDLARTLAREQSATTHAAPECLDACAFLATLLVEALAGATVVEVVRPRDWQGTPAVTALAAGNWRGKSRSAIASSGYVIHTLESALWSVGGALSFEDALITAVNLGGDADTVGAVTAQLAGALWGKSAIPERWLRPLAWREHIEATAIRLLRAGSL